MDILRLQKPSKISPKQPAADFYVAINGNDAWSGKLAAPAHAKTDGPFRTIERARDAIRRLRKSESNRSRRMTVIVRGGVYTLAGTFTLEAADSHTVYRVWPGEKAILRGGPTIPPTAFKAVTDRKVLRRLAPAVRRRVMEADLGALGIADLGTFPVECKGAPAVPELFFNERRMTLARWPDKGWATIARIVAPGSVPRFGEKENKGGVFEYSGDRPARWNVAGGVWLHGYWCYDWHSQFIRIKSVDRKRRRIKLAAAATYGIKQGNPSPRRFYAVNLIEELDRPGEYYIDRDSRKLYFWPPAKLAGARIALSTLMEPIVSIKNAEGLVLEGFTVEMSLGTGLVVKGGRNVRIRSCEVRNTLGLGIDVAGGTAHKIEACDIHDTGTGGISLGGGDRKTLTPAGHEALDNHIWRFAIHKPTASYALTLGGVGNRAAHNLIHDAPHQAVALPGNDHVFEYNIVHHVCMETDDCGACYKGRNPSCRGNMIRWNFWYDIGRPMGHGSAAVYFDDGDGGDTVFGNIFLRCGDPGRGSFGTVFSHGGHDILAANNIFIDCKRALGSAPWNDELWKETIDGGADCFWIMKLREEVDITRPPYTTRYPELIGFLDPQPGQPRVSRAVRNVFVRCADIKSGNWQVPPDKNLTIDRDPGFVDAARSDFRLKPRSLVFSRLPGFRPIPFEKIGLKSINRERASIHLVEPLVSSFLPFDQADQSTSPA